MDGDLPEHLEELACLVGQYDEDIDLDAVWPDIESKATYGLETKIKEKRRDNTSRFLEDPLRTLVERKLEPAFQKLVKGYRNQRKPRLTSDRNGGLDDKGEVRQISGVTSAKSTNDSSNGESHSGGKSAAASKLAASAKAGRTEIGKKMPKQAKTAIAKLKARQSRSDSKVPLAGKKAGKKTFMKPKHVLIMRQNRKLENLITEESSAGKLTATDSEETLGQSHRGTAAGSSSGRQHNQTALESSSDDNLQGKSVRDQHSDRAERYSVLHLPEAPEDLPTIYRELCFLLAKVPDRINWDVLAHQASTELAELIHRKKGEQPIAFTKSPFKELVSEEFYHSFFRYRMALRKAYAQPLNVLTGIAQLKTYDTIKKKCSLPPKRAYKIVLCKGAVWMSKLSAKPAPTAMGIPTEEAEEGDRNRAIVPSTSNHIEAKQSLDLREERGLPLTQPSPRVVMTGETAADVDMKAGEKNPDMNALSSMLPESSVIETGDSEDSRVENVLPPASAASNGVKPMGNGVNDADDQRIDENENMQVDDKKKWIAALSKMDVSEEGKPYGDDEAENPQKNVDCIKKSGDPATEGAVEETVDVVQQQIDSDTDEGDFDDEDDEEFSEPEDEADDESDFDDEARHTGKKETSLRRRTKHEAARAISKASDVEDTEDNNVDYDATQNSRQSLLRRKRYRAGVACPSDNESENSDVEKDKHPYARLTPELYELAELMGARKFPFNWKSIEDKASPSLKKLFNEKRSKYPNYATNPGGYLVRTQQRKNFRRLRRKIIGELGGNMIRNRIVTIKQFQQQKRVSVIKKLGVLNQDADESSLTVEERQLARILAKYESDEVIDWSQVEDEASLSLKRLIEIKRGLPDYETDPITRLVSEENSEKFKKVRAAFLGVSASESKELDIPIVDGMTDFTPIQLEFAVLAAEIKLHDNTSLTGAKQLYDWQYIFRYASPLLRKFLDDLAQQYPTFFRSPIRFIFSRNESKKDFPVLRAKFVAKLDKDKVAAKFKALYPVPIPKARLPPEAYKDIDEDMPEIFVELAEILEDIKDQYPDHHFNTVYDWDYIDKVASEPLKKHCTKKRSFPSFERSKMNTLIGKQRRTSFQLLRKRIREYRNSNRGSRGSGMTKAWELARFEDNMEENEKPNALLPDADLMPDLTPYLPEVTDLIEPELQLARLLEEIKFLNPGVEKEIIWDMDYIRYHAPGRLRRHLDRKQRLFPDTWQRHKLRTFVKVAHVDEFNKFRLKIRNLFQIGKLQPLPELIDMSKPTITHPAAFEETQSIKGLFTQAKGLARGQLSAPMNTKPDRSEEKNKPRAEVTGSCEASEASSKANGKAVAREMPKKVWIDDEDSMGASNRLEESVHDTDESFTDEEEMVNLRGSSRGIKLTRTLKELAIMWEVFNKTKLPDGQPDWNLLLTLVSAPLRRLILDKRRHTQTFKEDPSLLLVPPDLRSNFDRLRAETRRDPEYYTAHVADSIKKAAKQKKGKRLLSRSTVSNPNARKVPRTEEPELPVAAAVATGVEAVDVEVDANGTAGTIMKESEMEELARLLAKAQHKGKGWSYVEQHASDPLSLFICLAARNNVDYLDSPLRCLVSDDCWATFQMLRKDYLKAKHDDGGADDDDQDAGSNRVRAMLEQERGKFQAFSQKMKEAFDQFEQNNFV